VTMICRR